MVDFRGEGADGETETVVGVLLKSAAEVKEEVGGVGLGSGGAGEPKFVYFYGGFGRDNKMRILGKE